MTADEPVPGTEVVPTLARAHQTEIRRLYNQYTNIFKPLLAAVEVQQQELPSAILNEIRYFTDHISRCYWPDTTDTLISDNLRMAQGHLKRACLDCMKHSILYLHVQCIEDFDRRYRFVDLNAVADGAFNAEYHALVQEARRRQLEAKTKETRQPDDVVFDAYQDALDAYYALERFIVDHARGLRNARVWFTGRRWAYILVWFAALVLGVLLEEPIRAVWAFVRGIAG